MKAGDVLIEELTKALGDRLKNREVLQEHIADRLSCLAGKSIDQGQVSRWLRGETKPTLPHARKALADLTEEIRSGLWPGPPRARAASDDPAHPLTTQDVVRLRDQVREVKARTDEVLAVLEGALLSAGDREEEASNLAMRAVMDLPEHEAPEGGSAKRPTPLDDLPPNGTPRLDQ